MDQSHKWEMPRYLILLVVLGLHAALFAALLVTSQTANPSTAEERVVELVFLPPVNPRKARAEFVPSRRVTADLTLMKIVPPVLHSALTIAPLPASSSDGTGSGVDWAAEARRALQAAEIRNHEPPRNDSLSSAPKEDNWWPRAAHHAGDQFKTADGDWIVWIDASCYRVAGSRPSVYAPGAPPSRPVCPAVSGAAAN